MKLINQKDLNVDYNEIFGLLINNSFNNNNINKIFTDIKCVLSNQTDEDKCEYEQIDLLLNDDLIIKTGFIKDENITDFIEQNDIKGLNNKSFLEKNKNEIIIIINYEELDGSESDLILIFKEQII